MPCGKRADYILPKPEEPKSDPLEQIVKLKREMSQVQKRCKDAEANYGCDLLYLAVSKDYLTKLTTNEAVRSGLDRNTLDILKQFALIITTSSMEEALDQQACDENDDHANISYQSSPPPAFYVAFWRASMYRSKLSDHVDYASHYETDHPEEAQRQSLCGSLRKSRNDQQAHQATGRHAFSRASSSARAF